MALPGEPVVELVDAGGNAIPVCYPPTRVLCDVRYWPSVWCYSAPAISSTELAYGAVQRCPGMLSSYEGGAVCYQPMRELCSFRYCPTPCCYQPMHVLCSVQY
eukprot:3940745-Rhodomonas_salina.25